MHVNAGACTETRRWTDYMTRACRYQESTAAQTATSDRAATSPVTTDAHAATSGSLQMTSYSPAGSPSVDVAQPSPAAATSQPASGADEERYDDVVDVDQTAADTPPPPVTADHATSSDNFLLPPPRSIVASAAVERVPDDSIDDHATAATALTAAAEAVVRQTTAAAAPLILAASSGNVKD